MKKCFIVLVLTSAAAIGADFMTGQAARGVIGQKNFTALDSGDTAVTNNGTQYTLGAVSGLAFANDTLFVVDSNRIAATPVQNRVMIYKGMSKRLPAPTAEIIPSGYVRCPLCIGDPNVGTGADLEVGQTDFTGVGFASPPTQSSFRTPTGVASDGIRLVVADTDNNRVLIWLNLPTTNGQPADLVLGQKDFVSVQPAVTNSSSFRGPQGVWIQGNKLFVADAQNNRIMIWNNFPTTNNQPADVVLGQPSFTSAPSPLNLPPPAPNTLALPVSVTSDGTRLYVTDLGNNRVLIWNTIPTSNGQAADLVIGQPDMKSNVENNAASYNSSGVGTSVLCASNGTDSNNNPTFPQRCAATLSFPRYALSDGTRLFIADGGNDRILVYNTIPTANSPRADVIIGQPDEGSDNTTDSTDTFFPDSNIGRSSADTIRTPLSLAWDGTNLYASDPFDMRVLVYTPGAAIVPVNGFRNSASQTVYALGSVTFSGTINAGDTVTITIQGPGQTAGIDYKYTVVKTDTIVTIIQALVGLINANNGDPNVFARDNSAFAQLVLTAKQGGAAGNSIQLTTSTSTNAQIVATTSGATLNGGNNAAELAPGTLISLFIDPNSGFTISDETASADTTKPWPNQLGGVELYVDGNRAPISYVSPTQINAQLSWDVNDASSVSAYLRIVRKDGTVQFTTPVAIPVVGENPGIFADMGQDPRPALAYHATSNAIAVISVDGTITANDVATITIDGRSYSYTVQSSDTLDSIRDALIAEVNANPEERVVASAAGQYDRIILTAKVAGPDGNGIAIGSSTSASASVTITVLNSATCCSGTAGAPVTADNPAIAGEVIKIYATGLGIVGPSDDAKFAEQTGIPYSFTGLNTPNSPVADAEIGGLTATVLFSGLKYGTVGVYEVWLQIDSTVPTNPQTQLFIAQDVFTSNIVTIPVVNPNPPSQ
ncbi:MAG TPA: hypothetical protein VKU01_29665 [Bryobacteraceae bacterium]|nr:hypothetical protein [Bryobacteraceae bacterium]